MLPSTRFIVSVGCLAVALLTAGCKSSRKPSAESSTTLKPINVVFITLDTVRADHLHCYGYKKIETPVIDSLAANGVLFEKAVTQAPLTLPSHASMFTSTNPNVNHVRDTGGFTLQPSFRTLASILHQHGWNTAAFVSAFVFQRIFGFDQGFTVYDDRMPAGPDGEQQGTRSAAQTVDHALQWLNAQPSQPFFVWLHFYDAHQPFMPPPAQFSRQYPGDTYDAEIAYVDQQLGRFLDALRNQSAPQKTMIVLLSDHGEGLGQHGEYHHGIFLYDSTVRIAWIMTGPGIPHGLRVQQQARTIDVLPTILDLLGGKAPAAAQGTSMLPAFSGKRVATKYSYEETLYPKFNMGWAALRGIHTADWMYVRAPRPELYDLEKDPGELDNVIAAHPKKYRELENQLKQLSPLESNGGETIVSNTMDQQTVQHLQSLGYVGGATGETLHVDNSGADPKDRVEVLRLDHLAKDASSPAVSSSRKISLYRQALALDPTNPALYYDLGDEYMQHGQLDLALQTCLDALHHGIRTDMIFSRLGSLYLRQGNLNQAIENYQQAIQLNPLDVEAQSNLATAYSDAGQLNQASRQFQRVLAIQDYVPAYNGLGLVAVKQHDFVNARKNFNRALQINPKFASAQLNLGVLCMQTGDYPCARTAFQSFLADAPPAAFRDSIPRVKYALSTVLAQRQ